MEKDKMECIFVYALYIIILTNLSDVTSVI